MSRIKRAAIVLLLLLSIPLGLIVLRPDIVLDTLVRSSANTLGYQIVSMRVDHLGLRSTALAQLSLLSEDQRLDFSDMVVRYSPGGLLAGQLESIEIGLTEIAMRAAAQSQDAEPEETLSSLLDSFDEVPIGSLALSRIRFTGEDDGLQAELSLSSPPLRTAGSATAADVPDTVFEFSMNRSGPRELKILASAHYLDTAVLESDITLSVGSETTAVRANSEILLESLRDRLTDYLPATTVVFNDSLSLQSEFDVQQLFGEPVISNLNIVLDSPSSALHLAQDSDLGRSDMQLRLPITLRGDIANLAGELQLGLSEVYGTGSWVVGDEAVHLENTLIDTAMSCTSLRSCDLHTDWQSNLMQWRLGGYAGDGLSVTTALRFNYANDEMRLATDLVRVEVPSLASQDASLGLQLATSMQLSEVELRVGEVISGGFNFESSTFNLINDLVTVENPAYSGKLQLEDDVLTGILELDLDRRLRLGIGLQHFLLRDTGDVVIQLAAHEFTDAEPLSSLLGPKLIEADIVAGQVEGLINISWSKQQDESWRFGGPIALRLDGLSGYYADYFFVDFSTDLFAEATTPPGIQVTNPASASLGRIDIGLPLSNLSWQYRFDSLTGEMQLNDFTTELLGGSLSVPAVRYNPNRERQQMDVVLADLSVQALVALAEYPGVYADGLISGYLPFIIEGDTVTIDRGLVGALNPGGSIRYTPASPTPSNNPSLRLVNEALANYQYQRMNTEVFYDEQGELLLNVQLHGNNPDMNNGQAINLNVNISDNIPSLLKSLQASRVITEELERFVQQP